MLPPPFRRSRAVGSVRRRALQVAGVGVAIVAAYIGGMLLNDVIDQSFDEKHHPDRPLPQGLIPASCDRRGSLLRRAVFDSGWWLRPNRSGHFACCDCAVFLVSQIVGLAGRVASGDLPRHGGPAGCSHVGRWGQRYFNANCVDTYRRTWGRGCSHHGGGESGAPATAWSGWSGSFDQAFASWGLRSARPPGKYVYRLGDGSWHVGHAGMVGLGSCMRAKAAKRPSRRRWLHGLRGSPRLIWWWHRGCCMCHRWHWRPFVLFFLASCNDFSPQLETLMA